MVSALADVDWPVRTERLTIRRATLGDLEATWRFRRLDSVSEWLTSAPATLEEYRTQFENPDRLANTLVFQLDGLVIGDLMVAVEDAWSQSEVADQAKGVQAELGWVVDPAHEGKGYATEAVREVIRICFEELGMRRVTAGCFADNVGSRRLMERLGMRRETHARRDALHRSGRWLDGMSYAMLADEWTGASDGR
jgi:RimJ/RimL family protein N-acetyltransferase